MALTERHWSAIGVLGVGVVSMTSLYLFAKGRTMEGFALSVAATLTSTVFAAARVLHEPEACAPVKSGYGYPYDPEVS